MIEINKREMQYFQKLGYGFPDPLNKTHTRNCKYYLVENPKYLKLLEEFRNSNISVKE